MKEHRERGTIKGMRKNINKTDDPKNDDLSNYKPITDFFAYIERGFTSEYKHYNSLKEAIQDCDYNEVYFAKKIDEKTVKELKTEYNIKKTGTD